MVSFTNTGTVVYSFCISLKKTGLIQNKAVKHDVRTLPVTNILICIFIAPYGIREATEKIGTSKENFTVSEKHLPTHIPAKIEYGIKNIYSDLLKFSAKQLRLGGRLVCWFPVFR